MSRQRDRDLDGLKAEIARIGGEILRRRTKASMFEREGRRGKAIRHLVKANHLEYRREKLETKLRHLTSELTRTTPFHLRRLSRRMAQGAPL